jgi:hypothetical protein
MGVCRQAPGMVQWFVAQQQLDTEQHRCDAEMQPHGESRTKKKIGKKSILTAPGMPLQALRLNPHLGLGETGGPARWSKTICTQLQIMDVVQPLASRLYARLRNGRRSACLTAGERLGSIAHEGKRMGAL